MEKFDLNQSTQTGVITRLWGRAGDVFARLRVSNRGLLVEEDDTQATYLALRIPAGRIDGQPLSLSEGDLVEVSGYLTQQRIEVSLRRFLDSAGVRNFLSGVPECDLPAWHAIVFRRWGSVLNVTRLRPAPQTPINEVLVEGLVAQHWDYPRGEQVDRFARMAIYDRWTRTLEERNERGLQKRLAHYVSISFPNGRVDGREIAAKPRQRLRVSGELRDKSRRVSLHSALVETGNPGIAELIQRYPDTDRLKEITAQWESLHVQARAVVMYSR